MCREFKSFKLKNVPLMDLDWTLVRVNILYLQVVMITLKDLLIQMNFLWFLSQTNAKEQLPKN